jgi:hypothetical protein
MAMNPIPPQAYTKDTLVQAYAWLQNQNDSIKEIATSPDILVSLFLKAKLQGSDFLERPSLKNFKSELKNLAGMMGELDSGSAQQTSVPSASVGPSIPIGSTQTTLATPSNPNLSNSTSSLSANKSKETLDPLSQNMIREVKEMMNLSSESEAQRLLISVGHKQLKNLMKDK